MNTDLVYFVFWLGIMSSIIKKILKKFNKGDLNEMIDILTYIIVLGLVINKINELMNYGIETFGF